MSLHVKNHPAKSVRISSGSAQLGTLSVTIKMLNLVNVTLLYVLSIERHTVTHQGGVGQGHWEAGKHDLSEKVANVPSSWDEGYVHILWSLTVCSKLNLSTRTKSKWVWRCSRSSSPSARCVGTDGAADLAGFRIVGMSFGMAYSSSCMRVVVVIFFGLIILDIISVSNKDVERSIDSGDVYDWMKYRPCDRDTMFQSPLSPVPVWNPVFVWWECLQKHLLSISDVQQRRTDPQQLKTLS